MNDAPAFAQFCEQARADAMERTRRHVDHCILLAVVTSEDVAATLIDQAIALRQSSAVQPDPILLFA